MACVISVFCVIKPYLKDVLLSTYNFVVASVSLVGVNKLVILLLFKSNYL